MIRIPLAAALLPLVIGSGTLAQDAAPTDPQIAHIAYTAGALDIAAAEQAVRKSHNQEVRDFAELMIRDHAAVNDEALALIDELDVKPEDNPTSQALSADAAAKLKQFEALDGAAFDKAYVENEVAFHAAVNAAVEGALIPSAQNTELKALLETGLNLFREHQLHAEQLAEGIE